MSEYQVTGHGHRGDGPPVMGTLYDRKRNVFAEIRQVRVDSDGRVQLVCHVEGLPVPVVYVTGLD